jgi:hypothetical protein
MQNEKANLHQRSSMKPMMKLLKKHISKHPLIVFSCIAFLVLLVLPYLVWLIYFIGEKWGGIPTFLSKQEMVSYWATGLSASVSILMALIALKQTQELNDRDKMPIITLLDGNDWRLELYEDEAIYRTYTMIKINSGDKLRLIFQAANENALDFNITSFEIYKDREKIETLPPAGSEINVLQEKPLMICYSSNKIMPGQTYVGKLEITYKNIYEDTYKMKWEIKLIYTKQEKIIQGISAIGKPCKI